MHTHAIYVPYMYVYSRSSELFGVLVTLLA